VLRVPEYWVPLMVGVGLFLLGFIRWMTSRNPELAAGLAHR